MPMRKALAAVVRAHRYATAVEPTLQHTAPLSMAPVAVFKHR
jgi:hypothetical protein